MTVADSASAPPGVSGGSGGRPERALHLPDIHCAGCIRGVEDALSAVSGVLSARVNLTRKRVEVEAPGVDDDVLIEALARAGHRSLRLDTARAGTAPDGLRGLVTRIGVSGFAMMNVMLLSVAVWSGASDATAKLFHLVSAAIALPTVAYAARPFFASALRALSSGRLNMDAPISLAILLAAVVSLSTALSGRSEHVWFDAALALTFFLLIGRYFDQAGRRAARSAAAEIAALEAPRAILVERDAETEVAADALRPGDLIRLRPGDRVPADGVIVEGPTDIDRSAITGESRPEPAGAGDPVAAGETNLTGFATVRVDRAGPDTALARMAALVAAAETQRTRHTGIADRAARAYAPLVHLLSALAFAAWWAATGDVWRATQVAIAVLVITCPCALGLAVPAVSTVVAGRLFRSGVLIKSRTALERLSEVDLVAFDKTGTLTIGEARLETELDDRRLSLAAGLAAGSSHPVSRAVARAAKERGVTPIPAREISESPGLGVQGVADGRRIRLGRASWIGRSGADGAWFDDGGGAPVRLEFGETPDPDAAEAVAALVRAGLDVSLLSGDRKESVDAMAGALGIRRAEAGMTPRDKVDWLEARRSEGRRVLMVGDGLNDTGALSVAHASLAPGSAVDAARSAADGVILGGGPMNVPRALRDSRQAMLRMRQNIWIACLYNFVAVPIALAGLASPLIAAIAMSSSSITVTLNAMRPTR